MTKIEWCDYTINPFVGCSKCSPGCLNCYAEKFAARLAKNPATAKKYAGVVDENGWTGKISLEDFTCFNKLPKKPSRVFVGSMTDIFHENVNLHDLTDILDIISSRYLQHIFLFLTKRIENAAKIIPEHEIFPDNTWLGVTVCNQQEADEKLPILMKIPAAIRFVSVEPMLEPIIIPSPLPDWVICGAETGPDARPMILEWARDLRDQCKSAHTPFFFKKAGNKTPIPDDLMVREFPVGY